jgi:hypothetical protein
MRKIYIKKISIILCTIIFIAISVFYFIFKNKNSGELAKVSNQILPPPIIIEDRTPPKGLKEYQSKKYRFSLFFPAELSITQFSTPGSGQNITFETKDGKTGFQIFITKYDENYITEERFKLDVPSGVKLNPLDILVDGVKAKTFTSNNPAMGDTQEVWIINNGYLYEVVTYKSLEKILVAIISTWKFY